MKAPASMNPADRMTGILWWTALAAAPLVMVQIARVALFDPLAALFAVFALATGLRRLHDGSAEDTRLLLQVLLAFGALFVLYAPWTVFSLSSWLTHRRFLTDSATPALLAATAAAVALFAARSPAAPGAPLLGKILRGALALLFCAQFVLFALYFLAPEDFFLRPLYFALNLHDPVYKLSFPFRFSNQCAGFLALALPLYLALILRHETRRFWLWGLAAAFGFLAALHTGSRSAVVGIAAGCGLVFVWTFLGAWRGREEIPGGVWRSAARMLVVGAAFAGAVLLGATSCRTPADDLSPCRRTLSVFSMFAEGGYEEFRVRNNEAAFGEPRGEVQGLPRSKALRFALGVGPGRTVLLTPEGLEIHNTYLALFAEVGLLGVALYAAAALVCMRAFLRGLQRARRLEARSLLVGLGAGLISFAVAAGAHHYVRQRHPWLALGLAVGLALGEVRRASCGGKDVPCAE